MQPGRIDAPRAEAAVRELLAAAGYEASGDLARTPARVAGLAAAWAAGPLPVIDPAARIPAPGPGPVALARIPFRSLCEHHLLPFDGTASVVYRPGAWIAGIGRIVEVVEAVAARLQLQERLVDQVAEVVSRDLAAEGVLVHARAVHSCSWARGVGDARTELVATAVRGCWAGEGGTAEPFAVLGAAAGGAACS